MKLLFTIPLILIFSMVFSQQKILKYIDSSWNYTVKEKATYSVEFIKNGNVYECNSYYINSNKLFTKSVYFDTLFQRGKGLIVTYYESGKTKDSALFSEQGKLIYNYGLFENGKIKDSTKQNLNGAIIGYYLFHENGKLFIHNILKDNQVLKSEAFDETGKFMPDYIYEKPAEFPGGIQGWTTYLQNNLNSNIPVKKKAPVGKYTVYVTFTIDKEGNVNNVGADNNPGYGTMEEAIRVIKKGPKWIPAIQFNKPVLYRHKQGITFVVTEEK